VVIGRRESGLWVPRPHWPFCVDYMPRDRDLTVPLRAAERAVTRRARELFDAFTGTQRTVMGRDRRCPYLSSAGVCRALPDVGTVWCPRHRGRYTL